VWLKLAGGEVQAVNDLITYNLDIRQFAQDVIESCEDPDLLRAFWTGIREVTVLDPTCGSGAFLFAALNILEPLYEACLERMEHFITALPPDAHPEKFKDFRQVLGEIERHPNERYFIDKSIIVNNLYGVDIMHEAVEIAKLRLFLKLAALVEIDSRKPNQGIEPLPDIDFNIRAGNTLVGFATREQMVDAVRGNKLLLLPEEEEALARIEEQAADAERLFARFRAMQTHHELGQQADDYAQTKAQVRKRLSALAEELNRLLAIQYGVNPDKLTEYPQWLDSHQPFHWFAEYYGVIGKGGFDVGIGNPPYVVYRQISREYRVQGYRTEDCGNLYAFATERTLQILNNNGRMGFIIPVASVCTSGFASLQTLLRESSNLTISNYNDRPGRLFDGLEHIRLSIILSEKTKASPKRVYTTKYNKWNTIARPNLFSGLVYVASEDFITPGSIPKLSTPLEESILSKVLAQSKTVEHYLRSNGRHKIYYTRKLSGFVQILDFVPLIYDSIGNRREPSELKTLSFESLEHRNAFLALFNSSLFYWWLTIYSDCRNLNNRELRSIKFSTELANPETIRSLNSLAFELMADIKDKSRMLEMSYASGGKLVIQATYPKFSKPILDQIDSTLQEHYNLSDEQLDFIISYDIKYRMGDALADDEGDE
jgi:methylase of polypeptide subunit release factors